MGKEIFGCGNSKAERGFGNTHAKHVCAGGNSHALLPKCVGNDGLNAACRVDKKLQIGAKLQILLIDRLVSPRGNDNVGILNKRCNRIEFGIALVYYNLAAVFQSFKTFLVEHHISCAGVEKKSDFHSFLPFFI